MMTHASEGTLQAFLDDELPAENRSDLERHLGQCTVCTSELQSLRILGTEFSALMRETDRPAPTDWAHAAFRREHRAARGSPGGAGLYRPLRRAAILVLGVAGVASAAVPGSPVREWALALWDGDPAATAVQPEPVLEPRMAERSVATEAPAGISILPAEGRVRILLVSPAPELQVRVRLSEGDRAEVQATGRAAGARFRTGTGRIEVVEAGAGEVVIDLPRGARSASVEIDGKPYLSKDGDQLRLLAPTSDSAGAEVTFRIGS